MSPPWALTTWVMASYCWRLRAVSSAVTLRRMRNMTRSLRRRLIGLEELAIESFDTGISDSVKTEEAEDVADFNLIEVLKRWPNGQALRKKTESHRRRGSLTQRLSESSLVSRRAFTEGHSESTMLK